MISLFLQHSVYEIRNYVKVSHCAFRGVTKIKICHTLQKMLLQQRYLFTSHIFVEYNS